MSLRELYQEIIIDHGKKPRNFGKLADANHYQAGHNPLCGDKLTVFLHEKNNIVENIHFEGAGCAISVASASLMTEMVKGKSVQEIEKLFTGFHHLVTTGTEPQEEMGKLIAFGGVAEFPIRVKCATLAWHTLKAALANDPQIVTTEE
jgi:nitrogen fixation NifU-like protein